MIISPPFLPARAIGVSDAAYVAAAMPAAATTVPGTTVPEGSFPVSLQLGWHGGCHLHAPGAGTAVPAVRAIADGEIVFARRPTVRVATVTHALNYNPYGSTAAWTDDGIVIVQHQTDIGEGASAQQLPMTPARFTDMRCTNGAILVTPTDAAKGAEKIDIFGFPKN